MSEVKKLIFKMKNEQDYETRVALEECLVNMFDDKDEEIEQLKKRSSWLESGSIHTCHAECEKPLCVANREIERLRAIVLKIETQDSMSVDDMYFISGADKKITTLEAQVKELSGLRVCPACGEKYSDEPSSHPSYGALEVTIKALQLENEELKKLLTHHNDYITFLETEIPKLDSIKKALKVATKALAEITDKTESRAEFTRNALNIVSRSAIQKINTLTGEG